MPYTLWRGEELLGQSELELTTPTGRSGLFRATPAFEAVRPAFERRQALMKQSQAIVEGRRADLPPAEATRRALTESGLGPALVASRDELRGLGLVVRDRDGAPVPAGEIVVTELELPRWPDLSEEARRALAADFEAAGMTLDGPNWLLVLLPERPGRVLPNEGESQ